MKKNQLALAIALLAQLLAIPLHAADQTTQETKELLQLDLQTLMNMDVRVTSASRRETKLADAATAIAVITPDDIRRLGITSIPEALRLVPGLHVARMHANSWAISARGFNWEYASKLLVLVDGRTVYSPTYAGVYWHDQDLMLEDLARIEVIRGPGAALWGANAVNGVINIITKSADQTQGWLFSSAYGSEEQPSASVRYGGASEGDLHYRVYARYFDRDNFSYSNGRDIRDPWRSVRGGFRLDWQPLGPDRLTVQGDVYSTDAGQEWITISPVAPFVSSVDVMREHHGGHLLGRWTRQYSDTSSSSLQVYYDRLRHVDTGSVESRDTGDLDWQHRFKLGARHNVTWGVGYRVSSDDLQPVDYFFYTPRTRTTSLYSAFVQDEIALAAERLHLTLGSKIEHNDYTGFEVQPSARALWQYAENEVVWASVARAVHTPSRFDNDAHFNAGLLSQEPLVVPAVIGNRNLGSEQVTAYELGYRREISPTLSVDVSAFYNVYRHLLNYVDAGESFVDDDLPPEPLVVALLPSNSSSGETYGAELAMEWVPMERWRLNASYTRLQMRIRPAGAFVSPGDNPRNQFQLRSYFDVSPQLELNTAIYYVDRLPHWSVPSYVRFDLGILWRPGTSFELGLWGQNLLDDRHVEFASLNTTLRAEIPRTVLARAAWRF